MMSALTFYDYEMDENCYRVRLLLGMLGLEWTTVVVNMIPTEEHKTPEMLAINPSGSMPLLIDNGLHLTGTGAILLYLAKLHDPSGNLLPSEPQSFGNIIKWIGFYETALQPAFEFRLASLFGTSGDQTSLKVAARRAFRLMDDHMTARQIDGQEFFVTEHATLADIALFPTFALSRDYEIDHDAYPALRRWIRRVRTLKGFRSMPGIPDYH
jgi:glutathione S-transferase